MLPTSRPIRPIEDGRTNGDAATRSSAATKEDSSPAFVACFVLPPKQAETLISVLHEFMSNAEGLAPASFSTLAIAPNEDSTTVWLTHPEAAKCLGISTATQSRRESSLERSETVLSTAVPPSINSKSSTYAQHGERAAKRYNCGGA